MGNFYTGDDFLSNTAFNVCIYFQREHNPYTTAFICYLPYVSAVIGHHQVDFTTTYKEKHTEVKVFPKQLTF
jgi:hypothetical protein